MRRLVDAAMDRIVAHVTSLGEQPAQHTEGAAEFSRQLIEPMPEKGSEYEGLLDFLFDEAIPRTFNAAGPGYLAYVPGGGLFHAAIADLIADSVNRYVGVFAAAPVLVQLEANVIRWFNEIVGLPAGSGGVLTSGGSLANLTAIVTARRTRLPENFLSGRLYCSDQIHHSFQKSAILAGFPAEAIREIPTDSRFCIRIDALKEAIAADRAAGLQPFLVAGSAGTTASGAVDDLSELANVAKRESLWFHVDGAYGAFFMLTDRGRRIMKGIERADSIILDPHKSLFLPFGTGALLVRDASLLRRAHSTHADYMPTMQDDADLVDFCEISPELSRDFRGLRVWLPMKMFGAGVFRDQLEEKLDLAEWAAAELRGIEGIELLAEPQLSIAAFRLTRDGLRESGLDTLNRELLERINRRQRVMLTPATLDGKFAIRICIVSFRTHRDRVEMAIEDIRASVAELSRVATLTNHPV